MRSWIRRSRDFLICAFRLPDARSAAAEGGYSDREPWFPDGASRRRLLRELLLAYTDPGLPPAEAGRIRAVVHDRLAHLRPLTLPAARDPRLAEACELVAADEVHDRAVR